MLTCVTRTLAARTPRQGQWTYEAYRRLPDDGRRHEVLAGRLLVSPAPDVGHQALCTTLAAELMRMIADADRGVVLSAPIDVRLGPDAVVQPDVIALRGSWEDVTGAKFLARAPELVVEVLSRRTAKRDRGAKLRLYRDAGVLEHWLVDPGERIVTAFDFVDGAKSPRLAKEHVRSTAFPGVVVDLRLLWRRLAPKAR
jgi:Uma2 family endonuclease